jgi:hypothetical protein
MGWQGRGDGNSEEVTCVNVSEIKSVSNDDENDNHHRF